MSDVAPGAALAAEGKGEGGKGAGTAAAAASPGVTGHIYQVVPTTGLDGKNLLKLLPVSKPIGNFVPLHQSPVVSSNMKGNVSVPGHSNLEDLLANTTTSPFVKNPELKTATSGTLILPKLLGQVEKVDASVIKENPTTPVISSIIKENPTTQTIFSIQSNYHSADRSVLQNDGAPICSEKTNAGYILVNANSLPVAPTSQVLLSGHPLQIPAHTEVKSVPASLLPPSVQQKILATAASNASGVCEITKAPKVIYMSPANTVKSSASKALKNIRPKPITKVSETLILTVPQIAVSSSALYGVASDSKEQQASPIKWVVQENPQSSASYLVPVKSSNNMTSEMLNTFGNVKNTNNPASAVSASFNNLSESQAEITSTKDDTLVLYNGKMYLVTKTEPNAVSENKHSKQILPSDETHFRKQNSHLICSPADSTITNQVVSLVLSKSKGVACNPKDPKANENMRPQLPSELNKSLKVASTFLVSPQGNQQISCTSQHEAMSVQGNIPLGMTVDQKPVTRENTNQNLVQKNIFHKPAASALLLSAMPDAFKEEEEKQEDPTWSFAGQRRKCFVNIQCLMKRLNKYHSSYHVAGVSNTSPYKIDLNSWDNLKHKKEQDRQQYLELRKKNGLLKEERVYLRRIPISVTPTRQETTMCSSNGQMSDSCDFSERMPIKSELQEEEKVIEEPKEELNIKRKTNTAPISEHAKRKRSMVNPDVEQNDLYSAVNNLNSPCRQLESQQDNSQGFLHSDSNPCTQSNEDSNKLSPASDNCENETSHHEGSFREDIFSFSPPDFEDTIRDEKITRLKLLLREREAALEEIRKKMQQT